MLMSGFFSWTEFFSLDKHLELRHSELDLQQITKYSVHPSIDQVFALDIQKITKYLLLHAQKVTKYSHWRPRIKTSTHTGHSTDLQVQWIRQYLVLGPFFRFLKQ